MKLDTMFRLYRRMSNHMEACRQHRGTSFGILSDDDKWAREYQKREKGFRILEKRFISAIKKADESASFAQQAHAERPLAGRDRVMSGFRLCDEDCNHCTFFKDGNNRMISYVLNLLVNRFGDEAVGIVNKACPNLTCCYDCHIDDFCHVEGCKIAEMADEEMERQPTLLSDKLQTLMRMDAKATGTYDKEKGALSYIEEELTTAEYEMISPFYDWLVRNKKTFGHNLPQAWSEYQGEKDG